MVTQQWMPPAYAYAAEDTVATLLHQFMSAHGLSVDVLAEHLRCQANLVDRWLRGEVTEGLRTKFRSVFEQTTGIDVGRCMILDAKRILRLEGSVVAHDLWQTHSEILLVLRAAAERMTASVLAVAMGIDGRLLTSWITIPKNGEARKPEVDSLVRILRVLVRGLPPGNRDDVIFGHICQTVAAHAQVDVVLADYPCFIDALMRVQRAAQEQRGGMMAFERCSGIPRNQLVDFAQYIRDQPTQPKTYHASIERVVRYLLILEQPEMVASYDAIASVLFDNSPESLQSAIVAKESLGEGAVDRQAETSSLDASEAARIYLQAAARFDAATEGMQAAIERLAGATAASVDDTIAAAFAGLRPIGTTIDGTPFCLTTDTFRQWSGGTPPPGWEQYVIAVSREYRRVLGIAQQMPKPKRREFLRSPAFIGELREVVLTIMASKFDVVGTSEMELLEAQRDSFRGVTAQSPAPAGKGGR